MTGKFEKCPPYAEYLWELVTHGGFGTDVIDPDFSERIYTYVQVEREDVSLYPQLAEGEWYRLHEDENGFVYCVKSGPPTQGVNMRNEKMTLSLSRETDDGEDAYLVDVTYYPGRGATMLDPPEDDYIEVEAVWRDDKGRKGLLVMLELTDTENEWLLEQARDGAADNRAAALENAADARRDR